MRGRPIKAEIREKIASILSQVRFAYGYEIFKYYKKVFGEVSLRNIYYNLKKGLSLGEFIIIDIKREPGEYTWGKEVEHIYYGIGPYAILFQTNQRQIAKIKELQVKQKNIDWEKEINNKIMELEHGVAAFSNLSEKIGYDEKRKSLKKLKLNSELLKEWIKDKIEKDKRKQFYDKINEISKKIP